MGKKKEERVFKTFEEFKEYYFPQKKIDDDINPYENPFEYGRKLVREAFQAVSDHNLHQKKETKDQNIGIG